MLLRACHESARLVSFLCFLNGGSVLTPYFQVSLLLSHSQGRPARLGALMMLPQELVTRASRPTMAISDYRTSIIGLLVLPACPTVQTSSSKSPPSFMAKCSLATPTLGHDLSGGASRM